MEASNLVENPSEGPQTQKFFTTKEITKNKECNRDRYISSLLVCILYIFFRNFGGVIEILVFLPVLKHTYSLVLVKIKNANKGDEDCTLTAVSSIRFMIRNDVQPK